MRLVTNANVETCPGCLNKTHCTTYCKRGGWLDHWARREFNWSKQGAKHIVFNHGFAVAFTQTENGAICLTDALNEWRALRAAEKDATKQ